MLNYEVVFILDVALQQVDRDKLIESFSSLVKGSDGSVDKVECIGVRQLSYEIFKHTHGRYMVMLVSLSPSFVKEIKDFLTLNDSVIRFMIVRVKKGYFQHVLNRDAGYFTKSEESSVGENSEIQDKVVDEVQNKTSTISS